MKLVFAHDHIFYKYHNQYYSTGGLSREMLERYTNVFEKVVVISRQKELKEFDKSLTLASTPGVEFVEVPNFKKPSKILERRSEEHTSELQSRFDLVCRLLLEKKRQK